MRILLVESDRIMSKCITEECEKLGIAVAVCRDADEAVAAADTHTPDAVVVELSLAGHSGMEFLYEFRTYADWQDIPIYVYTTLKPSARIYDSIDWQLLKITEFLYKPNVSVPALLDKVMSAATV